MFLGVEMNQCEHPEVEGWGIDDGKASKRGSRGTSGESEWRLAVRFIRCPVSWAA